MKEIFRYLAAGGATTALNFGLYTALTRLAGIDENAANVMAVTAAVLFAYTVNKLFVFRAKSPGPAALIREMLSFFGGRLFTILLDIAGLFVLHTVMGINDLIVKAGLTILIVVLNYVISRFLVFKKA